MIWLLYKGFFMAGKTLLFKGRNTTLSIGDFVQINMDTNTASFLRGCETIYINLGAGFDSKIYIGPQSRDNLIKVIKEMTGFNVSEERNGDDLIIFKIIN